MPYSRDPGFPAFVRSEELTIGKDGAMLWRAALSRTELTILEEAVSAQPRSQAGIRLSGIPELRPFLSAAGPIGRIAVSGLGPACLPVRAILFDKSVYQNWSLGWHQDRTIVVKKRIDVSGFGPWSIKSAMNHVEPPFNLLAGMLTLRAHLDPVPATNAPLLIAPGSHRLGRIAVPEIPDVVKRCGTLPCLAEAGDIWLYATPILHASAAAASPAHRRVLQVDYAVGRLPGGLEWLGV